MKAILEFDLETEMIQFNHAINGHKWAHVVWDIDQHLRYNIKYCSDDVSEETTSALIKVREYLNQSVRDEGLQFE